MLKINKISNHIENTTTTTIKIRIQYNMKGNGNKGRRRSKISEFFITLSPDFL
jgi:hypothetical protein